MYQIKLIRDGRLVDSKDLGSWRDHAVEVYASVRRSLERSKSPVCVELYDTFTKETLYKSEVNQ